MIIRSQDKKTIVNFSNVTNICCGKDNEKCIYADFDCGEYEVLATYSTEEKAIKVLDMICKEYKNSNNSTSLGHYGFVENKYFRCHKIARCNMKEFIENLIGRLEELKELHKELIKDGLSVEYHSGCKALSEDAIEIVNQLAEEYNNDVCEWEKGSSGYVGYPAYYSRCCTTNSKGLEMQTHIISDWKFCPYCGKKIKVVE